MHAHDASNVLLSHYMPHRYGKNVGAFCLATHCWLPRYTYGGVKRVDLGSKGSMRVTMHTCVHAFIVINRVFVAHSLNVKDARQLEVNVSSQAAKQSVSAAAATGCGTTYNSQSASALAHHHRL